MPETTQFGDENENSQGEGSLKAGHILMNRYKILGVVGGGGQGAVYSSRDLNFPDAKRLVAIKEMRYPGQNDPGVRSVALATFQREANILATLNHPAIPKIFDFFDQGNRAYLIMEFINGSDLELLVNRTKELPLDRIIDWAIDLCDVLHYLHSHQPEPIIFRDVKPANIMIDALGKVRLIDFGIAKIFISGVKNTMIGTEGYSAPEQYKGDVNPLSDIYSLGATLHHIITRKDPRLEPPFSFSERALRDYNPTATEALQSIIDRALEMEPSRRYQDCQTMKEDLLQYKYGHKTNMGLETKMIAQRQQVQSGNATTTNGSSDVVQPRPAKKDLIGNETDFFEDADKVVQEAAIKAKWKFETEDELRGGPIVSKGRVYVGSYDTNMWAFDEQTGDFIWKYATNGGVATTPTCSEDAGLIYFGSEDKKLYAIDMHEGKMRWTFDTNGPIRSSPRVAHNHVFFGSDDGMVYAVNASSDRKLWEYDMRGPVRTKPYVTKDMVIVGAETGELAALELSGKRKWGIDLSKRGKPITSSPKVDEEEDICYVGCFDGYIYAIDANNGYTMWRFRTGQPIISSPVFHENLLYFGSVDGAVYALNSETAKEKWRFSTDKPVVAPPVYYDGKVYFGSTNGTFYCVDAKNGKKQWQFQTGEAITSAPYITENLILIASMDYTLYALPLVG
jgi:eukaryotic-like serine/threonine-protein kinase